MVKKMKQGSGFVKAVTLLVIQILLFAGTVNAQSLLDDFNRPANVVVGSPLKGNASWLETETTGSNDFRARIENGMVVMGNANNANVRSAGLEQVSVDVSGQYATVFNQASSELTWAFNFRQSHSGGTSGFGKTTYGIAYVLGATKANFTDADAFGYAIVIGNSGGPDPVRLIRFKNGLISNTNITTLLSSTPDTLETAYYSVKVGFEPCTKTWSLQVRNDNSTFVEPLSVAGTSLKITDSFYTNLALNFTGAAYNHGAATTSTPTAYFDNIYTPTAPSEIITYKWTGAVSSDFTDPNNWNPARTCNRLPDVLLFDNGGNVNVTNVTSVEFAQLYVQNNTTLTLKAKTGGAQNLQLAGGEADDLYVSENSALIIDSNDALTLTLKTGTTGKVLGTVAVQNTSNNLGRAHRLIATDPNALIFESGSLLMANRLSGEVFGNTGPANTVIFKTNATYTSKDGAGPFGLTSPNSKVVFETGSLYKHEQIGNTPKFDGRSYSNFILNVTGNLNLNFGTSALQTTQFDNFTINSGNLNILLTNGTTPLPIQIKGNLAIAPGATFNFNPAASVNTSLLTFSGTTPQQISGNLNLGQFANLEINNPAGVHSLSNLTIRGNLSLTKGVLALKNGVNLTFEDNATVSGASNASFVAGKVLKTGDDAFTFPTGKNGFYAPIGISAPATISDQFIAEYFQANPTQLFGAQISDSLVQISNSEYWDLERLAGTSEVKVTLSYDAARSGFQSNVQGLRVAHFKAGASWVNEGKTEVEISPAFSLIATALAQSSFSPFTFGSVITNNPLPVELLHFSALRNGDQAELSWETASELNNSHFEIERSSDGKQFYQIGKVNGQGTSNNQKRYAFTDKNPASTTQYYRLKQIDLDGTSSYSKIATVAETAKLLTVALYPNPTSDFLTLRSTSNIKQLHILNLTGQVVKRISFLNAGSELKIDLSVLPAGTYFLKPDISSPAIRFVKIN